MKKQNSKSEEAAILRQRAEELLQRKEKSHSISTNATEVDLLKLIYELQVHQIELEIQNEELAIANEKAELAEKKYAEFYDFAPSGFISLSKEGEILDLNYAAATMLGKERSELINNRLGFFVSLHTRPVFNLFLDTVFTSKIKQTCEVIIVTENNLPIYVNIDGIVSGNDEFFMLTLSDSNNRKLVELELQKAKAIAEESEAKLNTLFTSISEMVVLHELVFDEYGVPVNYRITDCNDAFTKITGIARDAAVGRLSTEVFGTDYPPYLKEYSEVAQTGKTQHYEAYFQPMDKHFSISVTSPAKNQFATVSSDITELKEVELILQKKNEEIASQNEEITVQNEELNQANQELMIAKVKAEKSEIELQLKNEEYESINEELLQTNDELIAAKDRAEESEEKTRYILKHNPNAIAVFDNQMNILIVSDRFLNDYNVQDKNIIGKNHYEVFPEMPEKWRNVHRRALQGEVLSNDDDYFIRPDGSITYSRWECRPWYRSDNSIGGMIAYTEVITERKLAELALKESERNLKFKNEEYEAINVELLKSNDELIAAKERAEESEEKLNSILINLSDVVWSISYPDLTHNFISPSLEKLYGRSKQELLDNPNLFQDITHPDDKHLTEKAMMQLLEEGKAERECRIIKPDGSIVWVNDRSKMIYDENQQPIRVDGVTSDITKRKHAEQELLKAKERAEESEKKYRMLFDLNKDSISLLGIGTDGKPTGFIDFNNAACDIFGYSREELMLMKLEDLEVPVPDSVMSQRLETLQSKGSVDFETVVNDKAGNKRYGGTSRPDKLSEQACIDEYYQRNHRAQTCRTTNNCCKRKS